MDDAEYVSESPSISDADRVIEMGVSSLVITAWLSAAGASLTATIFIDTVASLLSADPLFALNVKLSVP